MNNMIEPKWVSEKTVLALHDRQIAEFGGASGVRDMGLLQSALARPQNAYHYEQVTSLTRLASAYAFGIAKNHPFADGNKRAAFMACFLFLLKNGFTVQATEENKYVTMLSLAEGSISEADFVAWLDAHVQKDV